MVREIRFFFSPPHAAMAAWGGEKKKRISLTMKKPKG